MDKQDLIEKISDAINDVNFSINDDLNHDLTDVNEVVDGWCSYLIGNVTDIVNEV